MVLFVLCIQFTDMHTIYTVM